MNVTEEQLRSIVKEAVKEALGESNGSARLSPQLFRESDVAQCLGVSVSTLKQARLAGQFSAFSGKRPVLYSREQVEAARDWLIQKRT